MLVDRVLDAIGTERGPVHLGELSRRVGVPVSALEGMLQVLERKGVVARPHRSDGDGPVACASACGAGCTGVDTCPFVIRTER